MVRHTCLSMVMKKLAEGFVKYRMTEAMTANRDHDGPSRGPSTRTHFDRFSVIRVLLLLGFCFFISSWKNLTFGVDSLMLDSLSVDTWILDFVIVIILENL